MVETLWDLPYLHSLWASCITTFKGTRLNIIQFNWCLVCNSKGVNTNEKSFVRY